MNVTGRTCAPFVMEATWSGIDWDHYRRQTRRLHARIVKATQETAASPVPSREL